MIDIHCHILPGIDNGAEHMEESVSMARLAAESGVDAVIATPHFSGTEADLRIFRDVLTRMGELQTRLKEERISLSLHPGAEVLCSPETAMLAQKKLLPTLGNSSYVLVEFELDASAQYMDLMLDQLTRWGYRVVLAHPECYDEIQKRPQGVQRWFEKGYLLQVNKGSVLGASGTRTETVATDLLRRRLAHVIASDAHHADFGTTHMSAIAAWGREYLGAAYTKLLLQENPANILAGKPPRSFR